MYIKNIILYEYIFVYLIIITQSFEKSLQQNTEIIYTYENITSNEFYYDRFVYRYSNYITKEEVLKLSNYLDTAYFAYYCKKDICISVDNIYSKNFIEFPNDNGDIELFILNTYKNSTTEYTNPVDNKKLYNENNILGHIYFTCKTDLQCLSNKCINNHCIFNEKEPIIHCDNIYSFNVIFNKRKYYMYCGKPLYEPCNDNDECSSKKCNAIGLCSKQQEGPDYNEELKHIFVMFLINGFFLIIILIIYRYCGKKYPKSKKYIISIPILIHVLTLIYANYIL